MKHSDSTFTGIQIKTRQPNRTPWKTGDEEVRKSWMRFAKLEHQFPGRFRAYRFLTNHPFHSAGNGQDLREVLSVIARCGAIAELPSSISRVVGRVASGVPCPDEAAFEALSKSEASDDLPKFRDIESRLVDALTGVWSRASELSLPAVRAAARALVQECENASCLAHEGVLPAYLPAGSSPRDSETSARIAGKRMSRDRVLGVLEVGCDPAALLEADTTSLVEPGTGTSDMLIRKLDAGGFSAVSCNSAQDLRSKADYLGLVWTKKHGRVPGLQRYTLVRSLVLRDAAAAFEVARRGGEPFGCDMLAALRGFLSERRRQGSQLFDCTDEHLEGMAYALTAECQIRWSDSRPWEE